jgi:predicted PurR-regulated permease PerM
VGWFVSQVGNLGMITLQFLLTVIIAAVLFANGEEAASRLMRFARRLAGEQGEAVLRLAAQAIRGVALGVVVTALVQAFLGGVGLAVVGIPFAAILTAVMFVLCLAQLGPLLVLLPAVIWLYWQGHSVLGTILLVWLVVVSSLDNFLRPLLIRRGADLSLLLIVAGVIGGLIAFGFVGIFIGPVVLAVAHTLLEAWAKGA